MLLRFIIVCFGLSQWIYAQNPVNLHFTPSHSLSSTQFIDLRVNTLTLSPASTPDKKPNVHLTIDFSKMDLNKTYCTLDTEQLNFYTDYPSPKIRNPIMSSWTLEQDTDKDYFYAQANTVFFDAYHMQQENGLALYRINELPVFQFYYHPNKKCWEGDFLRSTLEWDKNINAYSMTIYNFTPKKKRLRRSLAGIVVDLSHE